MTKMTQQRIIPVCAHARARNALNLFSVISVIRVMGARFARRCETARSCEIGPAKRVSFAAQSSIWKPLTVAGMAAMHESVPAASGREEITMLIEVEPGIAVCHEQIHRVERTQTGCDIYLRGRCLPHQSTLTIEQIFAALGPDVLRAPPVLAERSAATEHDGEEPWPL